MISKAEKVKAMCEGDFDTAAVIDVNKLIFRDDVREMCKSGRCGSYGNNWGCPPGCGSVDECRERAGKYDKAIVVQTIGILEDSFDFEGMEKATSEHRARMTNIREKLQTELSDVLSLGAGPCKVCSECTCPHEPCRFPEKQFSSMEAQGLMVSEVCSDSGLKYINGENTVTYTGCFLIKE